MFGISPYGYFKKKKLKWRGKWVNNPRVEKLANYQCCNRIIK